MNDRTRAERALAFLLHEIRDEWDEHGILSALRKLSDKPLAEVSAAAIFCAHHRTDQRTPACIALSGEHWQALDRMANKAPAEPTYTPPAATEQTCRTHGDRMPCRGCAADMKAAADVLAQNEAAAEPIPRMEGESMFAWAMRIAETNTERQESTDD